MKTYTVELRKDSATKTITIVCTPTQIIGMVYERHPDWRIVRYY